MLTYSVRTCPSEEALEETIQGMIEDGWTPQGGVSITYDNSLGQIVYAQAVVRNEVGLMEDPVYGD